jgi:hypothetical protein
MKKAPEGAWCVIALVALGLWPGLLPYAVSATTSASVSFCGW